jgi:hypothetical protein
MDTPLHELAVPNADTSTLKKPEAAARELVAAIAAALPLRRDLGSSVAGRPGAAERTGAVIV